MLDYEYCHGRLCEEVRRADLLIPPPITICLSVAWYTKMTLLTNFTQNEKNDETTEQKIALAHCPALATRVLK
jgi:hypothetical protein